MRGHLQPFGEGKGSWGGRGLARLGVKVTSMMTVIYGSRITLRSITEQLQAAEAILALHR